MLIQCSILLHISSFKHLYQNIFHTVKAKVLTTSVAKYELIHVGKVGLQKVLKKTVQQKHAIMH